MPVTRRHITEIAIVDGTTPTEQVITFTVDGDISWENGEYEIHNHMDTVGDFTTEAPSRGNAQPTTWTLTAKQRGFGNASAVRANLTFMDAAMRTANFLSVMVSTASSGTACPDAESTHTLRITVDDCASGTVVYTFPMSYWSASVSVSQEGNQITMTGTSLVTRPTIA